MKTHIFDSGFWCFKIKPETQTVEPTFHFPYGLERQGYVLYAKTTGDKKFKALGWFKTELEALHALDITCKRYHGDSADGWASNFSARIARATKGQDDE